MLNVHSAFHCVNFIINSHTKTKGYKSISSKKRKKRKEKKFTTCTRTLKSRIQAMAQELRRDVSPTSEGIRIPILRTPSFQTRRRPTWGICNISIIPPHEHLRRHHRLSSLATQDHATVIVHKLERSIELVIALETHFFVNTRLSDERFDR